MNEYDILKNVAVTPARIANELTHPILGKTYFSRNVHVLLRKYADDFLTSGAQPRLLGLAGLRGTGKTTLLWHLAQHIHNKHNAQIYFFNVNTINNLGLTLFQTLEYFQDNILKQRFHSLDKPIVLLFDEIHDDPQWSKTLKILYDEAKWAFIMVTGSSALLLQQSADLARRMHIEKIYPFKFVEFLQVKTYFDPKYTISSKGLFPEKGVSASLKEILFYSENAQTAYQGLHGLSTRINSYYSKIQEYATLTKQSPQSLIQEYVSYHNIPSFLTYQTKSAILKDIIELFRRVVSEDIPKISSQPDRYLSSEKLLLRLAASDEINPQTLSQAIGISQDEILENINILSKAELLNVLIPFGGVDSKINKAKKAFFMSPSLRRALLSLIYGDVLTNDFKSKLFEDLVVMYLKRILPDSILSFVSQQKGAVPDFVIETMDRPVLLELGINKTKTGQIYKCGIDCRYGIVINTQIDKVELKDKVIMLPLNWFLLL